MSAPRAKWYKNYEATYKNIDEWHYYTAKSAFDKERFNGKVKLYTEQTKQLSIVAEQINEMSEALAAHITTTQQRKAVIHNPDNPYFRSDAQKYSSSVKLYTDMTYARGGVAAVCLIAAVMFLLFLGFNFATPLFLTGAGFLGWSTVHRGNFLNNRTDKYLITVDDFKSKFLRNLFNELEQIPQLYQRNIAVMPANRRGDVELDENALNKRVWEIAVHLKRLGVFYDGPKENIARTGDLLETALHEIRAEIEKLKETVLNLTDIAIVSTTNVIRDDFMNPTTADTLQGISRARLGAHRELEAAKTEQKKALERGSADEIAEHVIAQIKEAEMAGAKVALAGQVKEEADLENAKVYEE